jgi:hypothetical protein
MSASKKGASAGGVPPRYLLRFRASDYTRAGMWTRGTVIPKEVRRLAASSLDLVLALWELDDARGLASPFCLEGAIVRSSSRATMGRGVHAPEVESFLVIGVPSGCFVGSRRSGGAHLSRGGFRVSCAGVPTSTRPDLTWTATVDAPRTPRDPVDWVVVWSRLALLLRFAAAHERSAATAGARTNLMLPPRLGRNPVTVSVLATHLDALAEWCEDGELAMLSWLAVPG